MLQWFAYSPLDTSTAITFPTCPASVLSGVQPGWDQTWGLGGGSHRRDNDTREVDTHAHTHTHERERENHFLQAQNEIQELTFAVLSYDDVTR